MNDGYLCGRCSSNQQGTNECDEFHDEAKEWVMGGGVTKKIKENGNVCYSMADVYTYENLES